MKLKMLREHFQSNDNVNWIPKKSFETPQAARAAGFNSDEWNVYRCSVCTKVHVASRREKN